MKKKCRSSEVNYIKRRQRQAKWTSVFYHLFWIFPIKEKKIVITTFEGDGGFCCNPRYIAEELLKQETEYEIIWLVNNLKREFPKEIHKIRNSFLNRAFQLSTAQVWIDNSRKPYGTIKRKGQLYIQTWHAALGFKPVGKFRGKLFPRIAYLISEYDSNLADYVISNSKWCSSLYPKMLLYSGEIIKTGTPRCDIFITKRELLYKQVREQYDIPLNAKIVMYAPTFRGGSQKGKRKVFIEEPTLDFQLLVKSLQEKFGEEWYVLLRLHPQLAAQLEGIPIKNQSEHMIDVSQADDMNEILAAVDVLITDYSSSAFDAINMYLPVFLYCDDLQDYVCERGRLMWDMSELPFSVAETNVQLENNILLFNSDMYKTKVDTFQKIHEVLEDGHASERIAMRIEKHICQAALKNYE